MIINACLKKEPSQRKVNMGKPTGFKEFNRVNPPRENPNYRSSHFKEFYGNWTLEDSQNQGARCMNCAVPFCHSGCPLGNLIPDFNDAVYRNEWKEALSILHSTNNFPEFTGRLCPAPCESSCVLNINQDPVTIEYIEKAIVDKGWEEGWIEPSPPQIRTGKKIAIVGSGPSGLAAAQQLNRAGHSITVLERSEYIGGLLRLGIPDFKMEKSVIERRIKQMESEGIIFKTSTDVGNDISGSELLDNYDAVLLTIGSTIPRDLNIPGRELPGVHFAMEFLTQQNRVNSGQIFSSSNRINAEGKRVLILGGGDTGSDCLGTAIRQGAEIVYQYELVSEPPETRTSSNPWPEWPLILRTSTSQEEGGERGYDILTSKFTGNNKVEKMYAQKVSWGPPDESGRPQMSPINESEFEMDVDLVLLAMGFVHPQHEGIVSQLGLELDPRGNILTNDNKSTNIPNVFAAGDSSRGQSLVVWALAEGREVARQIDLSLMGKTQIRPVLQ